MIKLIKILIIIVVIKLNTYKLKPFIKVVILYKTYENCLLIIEIKKQYNKFKITLLDLVLL